MATEEPDDPWIEKWLSTGRFETFLIAANGSRSLALEIYEWNSKLGAAFLHDLGHLEVGIRNAYDVALSAAITAGDSHWTDTGTISQLFPVVLTIDPITKVEKDSNELPRNKIAQARIDASKYGSPRPVPGKIIAEIMFGFWTYLTSNAHEKTIWVPYLNSTFPSGTDRRKIHSTMADLRIFRNRVAHYEPIMNESELIRRKILNIASRIMPFEAYEHLKTNSEVSNLLKRKPY